MTMSAQSATSGGTLVAPTPNAVKVAPHAGEKKGVFISRCISRMADEGVDDNDQRVAMCHAMWESSISKQGMDREFSTTMVALSGSIAKSIEAMAAKIPDGDLHEKGREDEPHVTVKFGTHTDDPDDVAKVIEGTEPFEITFGKTSIFEKRGDDGEYDVVKVDVFGDGLKKLNKLISDSLEHTDTHPNYTPHSTLAYVAAGSGKKFVGMDDLDGQTVTVDSVVFSGKKAGERTTINFAKVEKAMSKFEFTSPVNIQKADNGEMYVEGAVLVPNEVDQQNDVIDAEEIRKAAYDYMRDSQFADVMHEECVDKKDAYLVESRLLKSAEKIGEHELPVGTWVVKFRIVSDEIKESIAKGEFTGFSICGYGERS